MALHSLQKEFVGLRQNPLHGCTVALVNDDMHHWEVTIKGPEGSPYESGTFILDIKVSPKYPAEHPQLTFKTKIYHPNVVSTSGLLCLEWDKVIKPGTNNFTVRNTLIATLSVMGVPNPDSPWNEDAANLYKTNRAAFNKEAEKWTQAYAQ